jgi:CRP-like cAMP-binding protein
MHPVVRKLTLFADLTAAEAAALETTLSDTFEVPAGKFVAHEGEAPETIYFVLSGFICRQKTLRSGERQTLAFLIPGDACDLGITILRERDHDLYAQTHCRLARVDEQDYRGLIEEFPKIRMAFRWSALQESSITREWIVNIGRRSAISRLAHLFCELHERMAAVGLADGQSCALPVSQAELADCISTSTVHANRILQELRARKLVAFGDRRLTILDLEGLQELAEFDGGYLHMSARYKVTA